jgi:DNA-binding transcriptional regulator YhcF (GntR family)
MRAVDFEPTGGQEPPQIQPGEYPGKLVKLPLKTLVPVQTVRHAYKTIKANQMIKQGNYKPIVVDQDNRIVNGHHRYDALKQAGHHDARVYKLEQSIEELL